MSNNRCIRNIARALALTMSALTVTAPLVACGNKNSKRSNENSPLVLATDVLDGVFNPFFYTSGTDGEIVSQTQIGMLSSDSTGGPLASWTEPCVAHDYSMVTTGSLSNGYNPSLQGDDRYFGFYTDYYFALKDDIKFSDGEPLTKDDVLFNIYMYLDPAYNGSNTMYSVGIKGLESYRAQVENASEAAASNSYFESLTTTRIENIYSWIDDDYAMWGDWDGYETYDDPNDTVLESDIEKVEELFKEEVKSDWTSAMAIEDVKKEYDRYVDANGNPLITENWQAFLYSYNIITFSRKYKANNVDYYYEINNTYCGENHRDCGGDHTEATMCDFVYRYFFDESNKSNTLIDKYKENLSNVITYYATGSTFRDYVRSDVISREVNSEDGLKVKTVSGIEIIRDDSIPVKDSSGNVTTRALKDKSGETKEFDILHIRINGVDPKAIQNFSFTVAPGHYYSGTWDKVKTGYGTEEENPYFGVEFSNSRFMDGIRQNQLPLGAGPYRASREGGGAARNKSEFFESNTVVYFERNSNFLLGAPKIKKLRYQVVNSNMLYDQIKSGAVHYGSPSMSYELIGKIVGEDRDKLRYEMADNLGYGYIGISARFVPNYWVRRAIMSTLDPQMCIDYYGGGDNASIIRRPMSKTLKPYYDEAAFSDYSNYSYYPYGSIDGNTQVADPSSPTGMREMTADEKRAAAKEIARSYVQDADKGNCQPRNGVLYDSKYGQSLRYTFTIAGNTEDHPAYNMLRKSADILNEIGFDITLKQDSRALSLLAAGELTVWAAAWSSSSDPDMYQVYHKDSKATSIQAWGYSFLNSNRSTDYERNLLTQLSDKIDEAREYTDADDRKPLYIEAQNMLMQLAIEFPTYQRKEYYVWQRGIFDEDTMFTGRDVGTYQSPLSRIWEVSFNEG